MRPEKSPKEIVETLANKIRPDVQQSRLSRTIKLVLDSFSYDHVFTELLQNADDCEDVTTATIEVTDNAVFFSHNGVPFNEEDLEAICDIGVTTKKPGSHIGFMGIGFKAAFKLSDTPHVFSGPYRFHFTREEIIVPYWVETPPQEVKTRLKEGVTLIYLPLRKNFPKDVLDSFLKLLKDTFEPLCLVFLKRLTELHIIDKNNIRILMKDFSQGNKAIVTENIGDKQKTHEFFVFKRTEKITETAKSDPRAKDSKRSDLETTDILLAFNVKDGILSPLRSVLYTFLPTPYETGLRFAINCDFLLNTQRTEPDWTSPWNRWLFNEIYFTLVDSVGKLLQDEKQRLVLYDLMPRTNEVSEDLASILVKPLIEYLKQSASVLTPENELAKPSEVALASKEIQLVIPPERAGVKYYVHYDVKGRDFLRDELDIQDMMGKNEEKRFVLNAVRDKEWLKSLRPKQMRNLYELLFRKIISQEANEKWSLDWWERKNLMEELEKLEVARCSDGNLYISRNSILPAEEKVLPQVTRLPCLHFVDSDVLSDQALKFLKEIGAQEFSEDSVASRILESHEKDEPIIWSEEDRFVCIDFFADYLQKKAPLPQQVEAKLESLFLPVEGGKWTHASACYEPDQKLKNLLPNANYLDTARLAEKKYQRALKKVGVLDFPRVVSHGEGGYSTPSGIAQDRWSNYWTWLGEESFRPYEGHSRKVRESFRLDGFDDYVLSQNEKALGEYLSYIVRHWDDYYKSYRNTSYQWFYYSQHSKNVPSYFAFQLITLRWLVTSRGLKIPNEAFSPTKEIIKIAGSLVPFVRLSQEEVKRAHEFLESIEVTTELDIDTLHGLLEKARSVPITEELKDQLGMLYERLYVEIEKMPEEEKPSYEWYLLSRNDEFMPVSKLYWIDDQELEELFGADISIAWIPLNLARPQLERLFDYLGIVKVSAILTRKLAAEVRGQIDLGMTKRIKSAADYIYSVLSHYSAEKLDVFLGLLEKLRVFKADNIVIEVVVSGIQKKTICSCFCDIENSALYVSTQALLEDISREIARAFGAPLDSAFPIEIVLSEEDRQNAANRLKRSSIQIIRLPMLEPIPEPEGALTPEATVKPSKPPEILSETLPGTASETTPETSTESQPNTPILQETAEETRKQRGEEKLPEASPSHETDLQRPKEPTIPTPSGLEFPVPRTKPPSPPEGEYVGPRPTTRVDHKPFEIEEKAKNIVIDYEMRVEGKEVQVVTNWANLGYDLISRGKDGSIRYIEIKGSAEDFDELGLTESQLEASKTYRDKYFIYRVAFTDTRPIIYSVQDPYPELEKTAEAITIYRLRGWSTIFSHKLKTLYLAEAKKTEENKEES